MLLGGCGKKEAAGETSAKPVAAAEKSEAEAGEGVTLKPEEAEKLGIAVTTVNAATFTPDTVGYGVVLSHDTLAQAVADVATAEAAVRQSRAALARVQRLAGTPGAFPAENLENAERQAAADAAALTLAQRRLSASLGQTPPWREDDNTVLAALASGRVKLVRATFPLGALSTAPRSLRLAHLDPNSAADSWKATTVWDAPADASIPGRSFFALLKDSDASEGERLQVWAASGAAENGVLIPAAAAVIRDNKYWCYVQKQDGVFARIEIDTSKPENDGYFVSTGVNAGDQVVTAAAGLLLARETHSGAEAE